MRTVSHDEWQREAEDKFGSDIMQWKFACPVCKHVAAVQDWRDAAAPKGAIAYSCVGRYAGGKARKAFEESGNGPCDYAGGGLFRLNPVKVTGGPGGDNYVFEFARDPNRPKRRSPARADRLERPL